MFRAIPCSSSGAQIVLLQHLVSSLSVSSYSVHRMRADCSALIGCLLLFLLSLLYFTQPSEVQY